MKAADKLRANWSKRENDVLLHYPLGFGTKSDGHWLSGVFNKEFTEELASRGYDVTTIKFSVEPRAGEYKFSSTRQETSVKCDHEWQTDSTGLLDTCKKCGEGRA